MRRHCREESPHLEVWRKRLLVVEVDQDAKIVLEGAWTPTTVHQELMQALGDLKNVDIQPAMKEIYVPLFVIHATNQSSQCRSLNALLAQHSSRYIITNNHKLCWTEQSTWQDKFRYLLLLKVNNVKAKRLIYWTHQVGKDLTSMWSHSLSRKAEV